MKKQIMVLMGLFALGSAGLDARPDTKKVTLKKIADKEKKSPMAVMSSGLSKSDVMHASETLNRINGDLSVLLFQTHSIHWNYTGPDFNEFHDLFGKQYDQIASSIDTIAERIRALDSHAMATMSDMLSVARLKEHNNNGMASSSMIASILEQYEEFIRSLRGDLETIPHGDAATKVILEDLLRTFEKMAWMVRSHHSSR